MNVSMEKIVDKTSDETVGVEDVPLRDQFAQENKQGVTCYRNGQCQRALDYFQKALAHGLALYPEKPHPSVAKCYHNLAST